jgi:hypothetical protein
VLEIIGEIVALVSGANRRDLPDGLSEAQGSDLSGNLFVKIKMVGRDRRAHRELLVIDRELKLA